MGSYCHVCDQFVENLDVCSRGEYHRDDYDPSCDYERYPMRDFSNWYRYEPEEEIYEQTFEEKLTSDEVWYQREIRTRSKSKKHRDEIICAEIRKILNIIERTSGIREKVALFEEILLIFKDNKYILKNNKSLSDTTIHKIDTFSEHNSEFIHLKSFKYQIFGTC